MHSSWQEDFFRGVALDTWRFITTPEMTKAEADFIDRSIQASRGARILDVPCGSGRHCLELAARGYELTGIDLAEEFITKARALAPRGVNWIQGDMRSMSLGSQFEGAFCFGNSFGYFSPEEAKQFLRTLSEALRPGARFVLDTGMVAESLLPQLVKNKWYRVGDILMLSENRYHPAESRLEIDYTFVRNGEVETRPTASYLFTAGELCRMHADAGLIPEHLYGSLKEEEYQIGSPRLLLVSRKVGGG